MRAPWGKPIHPYVGSGSAVTQPTLSVHPVRAGATVNSRPAVAFGDTPLIPQKVAMAFMSCIKRRESPTDKVKYLRASGQRAKAASRGFVKQRREKTMQTRFKMLVSAAMLSMSGAALAAGAAQGSVVVTMNLVDAKGIGSSIGQVTLTETPYGLVFTPALGGLPSGLHGFHVHENPSCEPKEQDGKPVPALSAGGHYDPAGSKKHGLPWGDGHLGDLPPLFVDTNGNAANPVLAPRLKMSNVKGRSVMVHAGGDNHADHPSPLGGGGARIACGVIQ